MALGYKHSLKESSENNAEWGGSRVAPNPKVTYGTAALRAFLKWQKYRNGIRSVVIRAEGCGTGNRREEGVSMRVTGGSRQRWNCPVSWLYQHHCLGYAALLGTSLRAQGLRLRLEMQGTRIRSSFGELRSHRSGASTPPCTAPTEPEHQTRGSIHVLQPRSDSAK